MTSLSNKQHALRVIAHHVFSTAKNNRNKIAAAHAAVHGYKEKIHRGRNRYVDPAEKFGKNYASRLEDVMQKPFPLQSAVLSGYTDVVRDMLADPAHRLMKASMYKPIDINAKDDRSRSALQCAVLREDVELAKLLLEHGADVEANPAGQVPTPLVIAILSKSDDKRKSVELVRLLLEHGASTVPHGDGSGGPTMYAARLAVENPGILTALLEHGVDIFQEQLTGVPAHVAGTQLAQAGTLTDAQKKLEKRLDLLIRHHLNPHALPQGKTHLQHAIQASDTKLVKMLLHRGANARAPDAHSRVPIHYLTHSTEPHTHKIVDLLLEHGASINATDRMGETAMHYAMRKQKPQVAKVLKSRGARVNITNKWGYTPRDRLYKSLDNAQKRHFIAGMTNAQRTTFLKRFSTLQ